jgi:RNA polymerase sigma factor (sigma-70 family)
MENKQKHVYNPEAIKKHARVFGIQEAEAQQLGPEELDSRVRTAYERAGLSYREKTVLDFRYGFGDGLEYNLEEVGHILKVTWERIRQIETKAMRKLQGSLEESLK